MPFHLVSLSDLDAHGDVYLDDSLGSLVVSGSSVYYIAEEKRPKAVSFTKGFRATFIHTFRVAGSFDSQVEFWVFISILIHTTNM